MLIGALQIELLIPESDSLKAKRFVLKSIKTRLRNKFNIAVSEVDHNEKWQRALLAIAMVSNEKQFLDKQKTQILNFLYQEHKVEVVDQQFEIL
jgi:uncharacterized protein YlxP (DUF503 family)